MALTLIVALGVCYLAGCNGELSPQALQQLNAARDAYNAGDDKTTIATMDQFLADNYANSQADQGYYLRGMARYRQKDTPGAQADFDQIAALSKTPQLRGMAFKALGDIHYQADDMTLAAEMYRQAIDNLDQTKPPTDEARYRLAQALQRMGLWSQADLQYSRLIFQFTNSQMARQAGRCIYATGWAIQTPPVRDKRTAQANADELKAKGLDAVVSAVPADEGMMFTVQVGRFATYQQAADQYEQVKAIQADTYITVIK
jgi:tetratricopeptide (TPR) repeat protein